MNGSAGVSPSSSSSNIPSPIKSIPEQKEEVTTPPPLGWNISPDSGLNFSPDLNISSDAGVNGSPSSTPDTPEAGLKVPKVSITSESPPLDGGAAQQFYDNDGKQYIEIKTYEENISPGDAESANDVQSVTTTTVTKVLETSNLDEDNNVKGDIGDGTTTLITKTTTITSSGDNDTSVIENNSITTTE